MKFTNTYYHCAQIEPITGINSKKKKKEREKTYNLLLHIFDWVKRARG